MSLNPKNKYINWISTIFTFIFVNTLEFTALHNSKFFFFDLNSEAIAQEKIQSGKVIAKSIGGRSGGGSFKKRSSGSRSPRKSSPTRSSGSRSRTKSSPQPIYNSRPRTSYPDRNYASPSYRNNYTRRSGSSNNGFFSVLFFLILGGVGLAVIFIVLKSIFANSSNEKKSDRERDNNLVTVSKLQVALLAEAKGVQKQLSELSLSIDTDTDEGLVELLRESVLVLLRNSDYWSYVLSDSFSLHIDKAESAFQQLSVAERSKFSAETLSNVAGKIKTREAIPADENDTAAYILVTILIGTADDRPLFENIHSQAELEAVLTKLASMRDDYLMKFELLWSPQTEEDSLTYDELITEYTELIKL